MTYNADGTATRKLLDALGLPAETDVIEWQTPEPAPTLSTVRPADGVVIELGTGSVVGAAPQWGDDSDATYATVTSTRSGSSSFVATATAVLAASTLTTLQGAAVKIRLRCMSSGPAPLQNPEVTIRQRFTSTVCVQNLSGGGEVPTGTPGWVEMTLAPVGGGLSTLLSLLAAGTAELRVKSPWPPAVDGSYVFTVYEAVLVVDTAKSGRPADVWVKDQDRTDALIEYAATHGRPSPLESVGPLTASVALARELLTDALPTAGERFRLALSADVGTALGVAEEEWPRFTGEVTDTVVNAEGVLSVVQVTGVGRRGRLGRVPVIASRPAELDGKRVRRVLYKARVRLPLDLGTFDPGTVTLRAVDYTGGDSAQGIVDTATASSLGQLVEHRSGRLDWHDAEHRRGVVPAVTLTGTDHVIKPFTWSQTVATVVNDVEVTYGPADARAVARVTDTASADVETGLGPYGAQVETELAEKADAYALGAEIVGRYARPSWMLPELTVDIVRTTLDRAAAVLSLSHGDKITAAGLPADGAFEAGDLFVEGTTESFVRTAWRVSLAVADPAIAGVGVRWRDVNPELTWDAVDPAVRWLDANVLEDSSGLGEPYVDGGTASSTVPTVTYDGGDSAAVHALTIDGGNAA